MIPTHSMGRNPVLSIRAPSTLSRQTGLCRRTGEMSWLETLESGPGSSSTADSVITSSLCAASVSSTVRQVDLTSSQGSF